MKAFLLAAGHGTRLRPLTDITPKCLLSIRGTPILELWLRLCRRHHVTDVLVNVHSHAEQVRRFISSNDFGVRVQVFEEETLLGSAGTVWANRDWVACEREFWVFYSDVL